MTGGAPESVSPETRTVSRGRRRRVRIAVAVAAVALAGTGVAVAVPWSSGSDSAPAAAEPTVRTVKVVRTDLTDSQSLDGTLGYGTPRTVKGTGEGTVTWLAPTGSTVSRGKPLYRVDDRPVPVFYGTVPLYRRLETPNTVGRDVRVIADNLQALGYDIGSRPSPGETVVVTEPAGGTASAGSEQDTASGAGAAGGGEQPGASAAASASASPHASSRSEKAGNEDTARSAATTRRVQVRSGDGVLTDGLIRAVRRWQAARGVPVTGVIDTGDVVVLGGPVRVEGADIQPGAPADGPLLRVTPTTKAVTIEVDAPQVGTVKRGDTVTVRLPDDTTAAGKVAAISTAAVKSEGQGDAGALKVTVTVTFKDPEKAKKFDSAPVKVDFGIETHKRVLAVPVTALLALREGGYGLRLANGRLVAVKAGLYAKGLVEVSGAGIAEGARVVTAS